MAQKFATPEEYFAYFSGETLDRLQALRSVIYKVEPNLTERISYNIPAYFKGKEMVCYIAGYDHHVSLYPGRIPGAEFESKFGAYLSGRSTLKFPHSEPLPLDLIEEFVRVRLEQK